MSEREILLVEDTATDEYLTLQALQDSGLRNPVAVCRDGADALDFLFGTGKHVGRRQAPLPQVILLDLKLPKVDGLEVLKRVRSEVSTRDLPVVVLTSSKEEADIVESYRLGANSYVRKPVDSTEFIFAVKQLGLFWVLVNEPCPVSRTALGQ